MQYEQSANNTDLLRGLTCMKCILNDVISFQLHVFGFVLCTFSVSWRSIKISINPVGTYQRQCVESSFQ